jgi:hypothetical protein
MIRVISLGKRVRRIGKANEWAITGYGNLDDPEKEAYVCVSGYDSLNRFSTRTIPFDYFVDNWEIIL